MTADRARRRAVLMLSALAGAMLLAGALPWATGGESSVRFLGLPLLLAGLLVLGVTLRVWVAGRRPAPSAPPVERRCDGCACGLTAGCATTDRSTGAPEPAAVPASTDRSTGAPEPAAARASADGSTGAPEPAAVRASADGSTGRAATVHASADRSTGAPEPAAVRASADGSAGRASAGG